MSAIADPLQSDARARRNVVVLFLAQAILGAQMPMHFVVAALAGQMLAPNPCFATLPISMIVLGSMLSATPNAAFMARHGRRAGFLVGTACGAVGAAISAYALIRGSFLLFLLGALLTGNFMSTSGFYRFAAADTASDAFRPKAISWVMGGGLLAGLIGPTLGTATADLSPVAFLGSYIAMIALNLIGAPLFLFLDIPRAPARAPGSDGGRDRWAILRDPAIRVAMICGMVSYALMNLVMTSSPLAVVGCGYDKVDAGHVVSAHVLAMYLPSFFTGTLIARFGAERIVGIGLVILAGAGAVSLTGVTLPHFFAALMLLGVGWNFGFIGATALLSSAYRPEEKERVQGINDFFVFGGVTLASLSSGGLMNCSGTDIVAGWHAVNIAMLPFLVLAGAALIWLVMRPRSF